MVFGLGGCGGGVSADKSSGAEEVEEETWNSMKSEEGLFPRQMKIPLLLLFLASGFETKLQLTVVRSFLMLLAAQRHERNRDGNPATAEIT